jgi:hypothetical protein
MTDSKDHYDKIIPIFDAIDFQIPLTQSADLNFQNFLTEELDKYTLMYESKFLKIVSETIQFDPSIKESVISKIENITTSIKQTVELFYRGRIFEATACFNKSLDSIFFSEIQALSEIEIGTNFYRVRKNENKHFSKQDLFHVKYEYRHIVSTNRYSVPGFPALYVGDSAYVCWEEFNKYKLRDLWFIRYSNTRKLNIIEIKRAEDFLLEMNKPKKGIPEITFLLRYLITFPLTIACSIKVKHPDGNFKPEYIIPQLLLQYISQNEEIDGIKFPSTKVDYSKLTDVDAYNYVFPVKEIKNTGFCNKLLDTFHSTEPTSLELEEIIYNPFAHGMFIGNGSHQNDKRYIELIQGRKSYYLTTSFGKIESSLKLRPIAKIA